MTNQQEFQQRFNEIAQKAQAGDAEAQYSLGLMFSRQNMEQALLWMNKAVDAGLPKAIFTLGIWYTEGAFITRNSPKGYELLTKAAEAGFHIADYIRPTLLAKGEGVEKDWSNAIKIVIGMGKQGDPKALSQLGFLSAMADTANDELTENLMLAAAEAGDPVSQYALAKRMIAAGKDKEKALTFLKLAARSGRHVLAAQDPKAQGFEIVSPPEGTGKALQAIDWDKVTEVLAVEPVPERKDYSDLVAQPLVRVFEHFLTDEEADYMVALAGPMLKPSQVVDHFKGEMVQKDYRTSHEMRFLPSTEDLVIHCINARIAKVTGEPLGHQEIQGVLHYEGGQEYKPHGDCFFPDIDGKNPEVERSGQRIKTFLLYLNEGYEGGETEFIKLGVHVKGKKGAGLMFSNVTAEGEPTRMSLHAGRPVTQGVKWLGTLWIRDREYFPPDVVIKKPGL